MNHTCICCGFAEIHAEVQSPDSSDWTQSEGQSSPLDHSFKKEEGEQDRPLPVHPEPTRPPVAPTQPYYRNGELPVHLSPSYSSMCTAEFLTSGVKCDFFHTCHRVSHGRIPSLLQASVRLGAGGFLLRAPSDEFQPHGAAARQRPVRQPHRPQRRTASAASGLQHPLLPHLQHLPLHHL